MQNKPTVRRGSGEHGVVSTAGREGEEVVRLADPALDTDPQQIPFRGLPIAEVQTSQQHIGALCLDFPNLDKSSKPTQNAAPPPREPQQPDNRIGERMMAVQGMTDLTHAERTVLSVIAYHDGSGGAWPSLQTIADKIGLSRARVSALVGEIDVKGRVDRKKTQRTTLYTLHYDRPRQNPAVTETVTAGIVDNSGNQESCRHGNRIPAVTETVTGTGSNRKVKTNVDQALSLKDGLIISAALERGSAPTKDFEVDLSKFMCVPSDPSEQESLKKEPGRNAQAILKREAPKRSTVQTDRKSKSTDSAKKPTTKKAKPFGRALPRSTAATAKTQTSKRSSTKRKRPAASSRAARPH